MHSKLLHTASLSTEKLYTAGFHTQLAFTHSKLYTQLAFAHNKHLHTASFYTQQAFTHSKPSHREAFTHSKPSHGEASIHSSLHTEKLLHAANLHTEKLLHATSLRTKKLFHTEAFTHSKHLHREAFPHRSFCTKKSIYTQRLLFTHRSYGRRACRRQLNRKDGDFRQVSVRSNISNICVVYCHITGIRCILHVFTYSCIHVKRLVNRRRVSMRDLDAVPIVLHFLGIPLNSNIQI